jgi:transcriptional regulator GlxA family with amidase domain
MLHACSARVTAHAILPVMTGPPPQRHGLLLVPQFSLIALAAVVDPLRLANGVLERRAYEWVTLGLSGEPVMSSDGIRVVPDAAVADGLGFDTVLVIGPNPIPRRGFTEIAAWLRRQAARGSAVGGVDTGAYYLAQAGLLHDHRCTIHWEDRERLLENFPNLQVTHRLFEVDRDRYTCSGGVSPLDMMIWLLSRPPGSRELAEQVAHLLVAQRREADALQNVPLRERFANVPAPVLDALALMENNLEEPLRVDEIAHYLHTSRRTLERLFGQHLQTTPSRKYLELRLVRARLAVLRSQRSLDDIAQSFGFASTSHFVARYRQMHGRTPAADRFGQAAAVPTSNAA